MPDGLLDYSPAARPISRREYGLLEPELPTYDGPSVRSGHSTDPTMSITDDGAAWLKAAVMLGMLPGSGRSGGMRSGGFVGRPQPQFGRRQPPESFGPPAELAPARYEPLPVPQTTLETYVPQRSVGRMPTGFAPPTREYTPAEWQGPVYRPQPNPAYGGSMASERRAVDREMAPWSGPVYRPQANPAYGRSLVSERPYRNEGAEWTGPVYDPRGANTRGSDINGSFINLQRRIDALRTEAITNPSRLPEIEAEITLLRQRQSILP